MVVTSAADTANHRERRRGSHRTESFQTALSPLSVAPTWHHQCEVSLRQQAGERVSLQSSLSIVRGDAHGRDSNVKQSKTTTARVLVISSNAR